MKKTVAIVGGGLGGLSAAITLANAGWNVHIFEKNAHWGGKLMPVTLGNATFDFGPNTITMPEIFQHVIEQTGERASDYFELVQLPVHTRNYFSDGSSFEFSANSDLMRAQLKELDPYGYEKWPAFLAEIEKLYYLSKDYFFPRTFSSWRDYLSPSLSKAFLQVHPFETLDHFFRRFFKNENVIQALNRYATYIGSSPYTTPATFAMIAYLEFQQGVYYVKGGNTKISDAFVQVGQKLGVHFHSETEVSKIHIQNKKARSLTTKDGETFSFDHVILNGDLLSSYIHLIDEEHRPSFSKKKRDAYEPSISAFVMMLETTKRFPELLHHTVYFSDSYKEEFQTLFQQESYAMNPTIYLSNSSYTDEQRGPDGDNLFILVNAPALRADGFMQIDEQYYRTHILEKLNKQGLDIAPYIRREEIWTPKHIEQKFHAHRGALYGISTNNRLNAFLRPYNFSKDIENVSFVGGSTHPGGGSPMVTLSGLNVARKVDEARLKAEK